MAVTNGLAVGSFVGIIFYLLTWWTITVIIKSKKEKDTNPLLMLLAIKVFILKFPILGVGLWLAFKYIAINPFALVGGIAVTQIAIVVSALNKLFEK